MDQQGIHTQQQESQNLLGKEKQENRKENKEISKKFQKKEERTQCYTIKNITDLFTVYIITPKSQDPIF